MSTVLGTIRRLMPNGSDSARASSGSPEWSKCPWWPPDVFAIAATLVNESGCYSQPHFSACCASDFAFDPAYLDRVERAARAWQQSPAGDPPQEVADLWLELVDRHGASDVQDPAWQATAMTLLAIADEASLGIGFSVAVEEDQSTLATIAMIEHYNVMRAGRGDTQQDERMFPDIRTSLCQMVPISEACVQPKSVTPQVGCSLRSLSHNLALLPSNGEVASSWLIATDDKALENEALNVLLVPFPYAISGGCFRGMEEFAIRARNGVRQRFFGLEQKWMDYNGSTVTASALAEHLVLPMMRRAQDEVGSVNAVVFPETALPQTVADELSVILEKEAGLEFLIAGTLEEPSDSLARNQVAAYFYGELEDGGRGMIHKPFPVLGKCHRWRLEESQVLRYHLGHALAPKDCLWWERIDIRHRACRFSEFRQGAILAAMVCEDLARFEPVHPIVRAVGPNLVVVLLMDGPQLKGRWPSHYAGVLADDPGSAVLTLTSLGMTRRSVSPGSAEPREIALWKQPGGDAHELRLPAGHQGLVLTLSGYAVEHFTLDGRSDNGATRRFELSGIRPVKITDREMGPFAGHFA